jgi:single-strand DNA-binding protein
LCNDPELRYTQGGTAVASFRLAVNTYYSKDDTTKQDTAFVAVTTWAGLAETVAKFMKKGRLILLSGRLVTHTWETEQGDKRSALQVTAESIQFLGVPNKQESSAE